MNTATPITETVVAYVGDVTSVLQEIPKQSIHCVVTSPPYFGLRSYLPKDSPLKAQEIGSEKTPAEYIEKMVGVFRGVREVLRDDGTLWLNLGDTYAANRSQQAPSTKGGTKHSPAQGFDGSSMRVPLGLKAKDLIGIPWAVAFALRDDGWYLRSTAPWVKRNAMPESVDDRPNSSLEYIFQFTKSPDYFYDAEAVKRPVAASTENDKRIGTERTGDFEQAGKDFGEGTSASRRNVRNATGDKTGRNRRNGDWWFESVGMFLAQDGEVLGFDVVPKSYKGAHFACFPPKLIEPIIKAGTSEHGVCVHCGAPWERELEKKRVPTRPGEDTKVTGDSSVDGNRDPQRHVTETRTVGWKPTCECEPQEVEPAVVLDPFGGSGTTAAVCKQLNRRCVLIDLNEDYLNLQRERVAAAC